MKKFIAILAFGLAANVASAQWYGAVEAEDSKNRVTQADSIGTGVVMGYKSGTTQYSAKVSTSQAEWGNGNITTGYEARVKQSYNIGSVVTPYAQGRLGERVESGRNFSYYALDLGTVIAVYPKFDVDLSYRYRNAFNNDNTFETNRYGIEGKYKLTNKDSLGLRYARSYNDSETNSWRLQYQHNF